MSRNRTQKRKKTRNKKISKSEKFAEKLLAILFAGEKKKEPVEEENKRNVIRINDFY